MTWHNDINNSGKWKSYFSYKLYLDYDHRDKIQKRMYKTLNIIPLLLLQNRKSYLNNLGERKKIFANKLRN